MPKASLLVPTLLLFAASPAGAITLDFGEFSHGDIVTSSQGVTIQTTNIGGGPDIGLAFDTDESGTLDSDLELGGGWSTGNLAPATPLGNVLIIQEHSGSCDATACTRPDDEGTRPAGSFDLNFSALGTFDTFTMDLVDLESSTAEPGTVVFHMGLVHVATVSFMDFLVDPTVVYGDNSANHVDVISGVTFNRVVINMGGSGGVDNLTATNQVPEPSAALLFGLGSATLAAGIRRRSRL